VLYSIDDASAVAVTREVWADAQESQETKGPAADESDRALPGETSCLSMCWAVLDLFLAGA